MRERVEVNCEFLRILLDFPGDVSIESIPLGDVGLIFPDVQKLDVFDEDLNSEELPKTVLNWMQNNQLKGRTLRSIKEEYCK